MAFQGFKCATGGGGRNFSIQRYGGKIFETKAERRRVALLLCDTHTHFWLSYISEEDARRAARAKSGNKLYKLGCVICTKQTLWLCVAQEEKLSTLYKRARASKRKWKWKRNKSNKWVAGEGVVWVYIASDDGVVIGWRRLIYRKLERCKLWNLCRRIRIFKAHG